jgi:hypothetical protein
MWEVNSVESFVVVRTVADVSCLLLVVCCCCVSLYVRGQLLFVYSCSWRILDLTFPSLSPSPTHHSDSTYPSTPPLFLHPRACVPVATRSCPSSCGAWCLWTCSQARWLGGNSGCCSSERRPGSRGGTGGRRGVGVGVGWVGSQQLVEQGVEQGVEEGVIMEKVGAQRGK